MYLLDITDDLILAQILRQQDPSLISNVQNNHLKLMANKEFQQILKSSTEENVKHYYASGLTPDEAVINEMVEGLCTKRQKATFVKIIAKYIR